MMKNGMSETARKRLREMMKYTIVYPRGARVKNKEQDESK
jgi:hypothetical protein